MQGNNTIREICDPFNFVFHKDYGHSFFCHCPDQTKDFAGADRMIRVTGFLDALGTLQGGRADDGEGEELEPMEVICYAIRGWDDLMTGVTGMQ